jgi:glucose/arabinose dehydrogenase
VFTVPLGRVLLFGSRARIWLLSLLVLAPWPASAQKAWELATLRDGEVVVSILAMNTLTSAGGAIDYRPALAISCRAKRYPVWRQTVRLRASVSAPDQIDVMVRYDNAASTEEAWTVSERGRAFFRDGGDTIGRLTRARLMRMEWPMRGLWRRGEAVFDVSAASDAVESLRKACGVAPP